MGKSRSATAVIMFLMKYCEVSFEDAYEYAKLHRQKVEPNEGFIEKLRAFEQSNKEFQQKEQEQANIEISEADAQTKL